IGVDRKNPRKFEGGRACFFQERTARKTGRVSFQTRDGPSCWAAEPIARLDPPTSKARAGNRNLVEPVECLHFRTSPKTPCLSSRSASEGPLHSTTAGRCI